MTKEKRIESLNESAMNNLRALQALEDYPVQDEKTYRLARQEYLGSFEDYLVQLAALVDVLPDGNRSFSWGRVIRVHKVGRYAVVEYDDKKERRRFFFAYIFDFTKIRRAGMWRSTSHSFTSLEGALSFAIAYMRDDAGPNSKAAHYFMRMLNPRSEEMSWTS